MSIVDSRRASTRAFTLVELMVVMGIISLLMAIALPALNAARKAAKKTATEAMISTLGTGCEMFHSDSTYGGAYPPSNACTRYQVVSPHVAAATKIDLFGANLLVWGLAGADLLGTPGFRDLNNGGTADDAFGGWTDNTSAVYVAPPGISGLYAINTSTGKPVYPRSAPYVDLSKVKTTKRIGTSGVFEIPAGTQHTASLCFLDAFDQPILYYRANPNAPYMAALGSGAGPNKTGNENDYTYVPPSGNGRYDPLGVYNMLDNFAFTGGKTEEGTASNLGAGTNHFNRLASGLYPLGDPAKLPTDPTQPRESFVYHIGNPNVTAIPQAQRTDSFVLLSAGADGLFGTADDVANFPINK